MKRKSALLLAAGLLVIVVIGTLAGCGGSTKVTGSTSGQVSEAQFGAPVYPGATKTNSIGNFRMPQPGLSTPQPGESRPNFNLRGSSVPRAVNRGSSISLWTPDSQSKVSAWYRKALSGKPDLHEVTPSSGVASAPQFGARTMFTFKSGDTSKMITIRKDTFNKKGGTNITVGDVPQGINGFPRNQ